MTTYNTKNQVPSADARDRYDNSQVFDELMNGPAPSTPDRLGVLRQSWRGMEQAFIGSEAERAAAFQAFLESSGWSNLGEYASGISIISHTQTVDYQGQPYQLKPSVPASIGAPYVTTGNWATEGVNFKLVGDNSLRQDLADEAVGAKILAFSRDEDYLPGTAGVALRSSGVSPWEFADLLTYKPGIDPGGWDWSPAFNAALNKYGELSPGRGRYGLASPVFTEPGMRLRGHGPGHAGGTAYSDIFATVLIALPGFVGDAVFLGRINSPENVLTAPQLEQFRLDLSQCNSHGMHLSSAYDGTLMNNLHIVGTPDDKYAMWLDGGSYGLAQTLLATNVQCLGRASSTRTMAVARFDALNESNFIGCKWFGASGGVLASAGAAVEFAGCSGITMVGSSTAFSADGVAIVDHPVRKTNGFTMMSPTFEAHTRSAFTCKPNAARKATEVYIVAPRYYDSVFTMVNAADVDNIERSSFDCQFKRAIVGAGADQNTVYAQRQSYLTDNGTNTTIISTPNASDPYYAINKRIKAIGGLTCDSGLAQRVAVFTAATGAISSSIKTVIVNRATIGKYTLPSAAAFGAGFSMEIVFRSVGSGSIELSRIGSDLIEGAETFTIASGGKSRLVSDGVISWYSV